MIVITAAGRNERFNNIPKVLLPVSQKETLITRHVDIISELTNELIVIPCSPELSPYMKFVLRKSKCIIVQSDPFSMPSSVLDAIQGLEDDVYRIIMGDTFFEKESVYEKIVQDFDSEVNLGLWKCPDDLRGQVGQISVRDNKILLSDKQDKFGFDYMWGTINFKRKFIEKIKREDSHMGFSFLRSNDLSHTMMDGQFYDCGSFEKYFKMLKDLDETI